MSAVAAPAERLVTLSGVSWETYERLLCDYQDRPGTRFTYNEGDLEIMVLSARHEQPNRILATIVEVVAEEFGIDVSPLGSTTFKRQDLIKGFEPDTGYYIGHAAEMGGRDVDPAVDPPPDLTIEVDVTSRSLNRFPIFAAFGIPEVWRCHEWRVTIYRLEGGRYVEVESSAVLPLLTGALLTRFLEDSRRLRSTAWLRLVRDWARRQR